MNPLKVAVIGVGHLGAIHARLWQQVDGALLTGVYDSDRQRAQALAHEHGVTAFASLEECLATAEAITIAAPTSAHFELADQCLRAGKHCFIEKPITARYEQAAELISLARRQNLVVQVGHVERFNPALNAIRDYDLAPMFIEAHRLAQFKPRATDVSVVLDLMIHDIDIVLWLVKSEVESIDASGVAVLTETPDIANARIRFKNGCVANLTASRMSVQQMRKMRLFQKNTYISLDFGKSSVDVYRLKEDGEQNGGIPAHMLGEIELGTHKKNIVYEKPPVRPGNAILNEQEQFLEAIRSQGPSPVTAGEGAEALRIAEKISSLVQLKA